MAVLALPTDGAPSMRPLSFHFDGESGLYFIYVLGDESRKAELSERADAARLRRGRGRRERRGTTGNDGERRGTGTTGNAEVRGDVPRIDILPYFARG